MFSSGSLSDESKCQKPLTLTADKHRWIKKTVRFIFFAADARRWTQMNPTAKIYLRLQHTYKPLINADEPKLKPENVTVFGSYRRVSAFIGG
jgi:hypothetical protein